MPLISSDFIHSDAICFTFIISIKLKFFVILMKMDTNSRYFRNVGVVKMFVTYYFHIIFQLKL